MLFGQNAHEEKLVIVKWSDCPTLGQVIFTIRLVSPSVHTVQVGFILRMKISFETLSFLSKQTARQTQIHLDINDHPLP